MTARAIAPLSSPLDFPEFRLIRQPNKGLAVARNVGMQAARGEIIAYTDSDCVVDPHWLTIAVRSMVENNFDGCGGPNYAPHEDGWIEASCAASPGAPCHVLVAGDRAEHLAGCNMLFAKAALEKIGGFDPQFTAAGDDVDICWRMLDAGFKLGFSPAAFVWHFRRNTLKAYYGQQRGYGRAEAMLYPKYPERFNLLGQIAWRGVIPGLARTIPGGSSDARDVEKRDRRHTDAFRSRTYPGDGSPADARMDDAIGNRDRRVDDTRRLDHSGGCDARARADLGALLCVACAARKISRQFHRAAADRVSCLYGPDGANDDALQNAGESPDRTRRRKRRAPTPNHRTG